MAERLSTLNVIDRLHDLMCDARGLEMAIGGAASLDRTEQHALDRMAERLADALRDLYSQLDSQHVAEREARVTE
jgi:hypothetical protein